MAKRKNIIILFGEYSTLAFLIPAGAFTGYAIGYFLDRKFGTGFWYMVFLLIGIAGGLIQLLRQLKRIEKRNQ
jgi:F0F1-type ATP synthase assembly protein I